MTEQEALARMVAPGTRRKGKWREGVIQVWVTRACNNACFGCTQGSNLGGKLEFMPPELFEQALLSLRGYYGVIGVFGGNPALHPQFPELCALMRKHVPFEQRGLWCNDPTTHASEMRATFNPRHSNLNVHMDRQAYTRFKAGWPESMPFGLDQDSRHSPVHLAMRDVLYATCDTCWEKTPVNAHEALGGVDAECKVCKGQVRYYDEAKAWELISRCDINQHWSAMVGMFRGELRAWFCEVAGAQAMLHQYEPDYPDTGLDPTLGEVQWWQLPMDAFRNQVSKHCHECGVPLRGKGELAMSSDGVEQTSPTHAGVFVPKRKGRHVQVVTNIVQLGTERVGRVIDYVKNARK